MNSILRRAAVNSIGTLAYIVLVVLLISYMQRFSGEKDNIIIPVAMLLLFVCSAAITGLLVLGKPAMLYMDGKKSDAVRLLVHTIGMLVVMTALAFVFMIIGLNA